MEDNNTTMRALGDKHGFVVVQPNATPSPPNSTWNPSTDDPKVKSFLALAIDAYKIDNKRVHMTGFSQGGMMTSRFLCKYADLFASVAPATAGSSTGTSNGFTCNGVNEVSCPFDATRPGGMPSVEVPTLMLIGRTDTPVPLGCTSRIRQQAVAAWSMTEQPSVAGNAEYTHRRWSNAKGTVLETLEHSYETVASGPFGSAKGHCFPGSTLDPFAPQYAVPCKLPNAFTWGEQVMAFFEAHPKK